MTLNCTAKIVSNTEHRKKFTRKAIADIISTEGFFELPLGELLYIT